MNRRAFIAGVGSAAAWPLAARAQQTAKPIVAILTSSPPTNNFRLHFSQGLAETGFVDGQNVTVEMHSADGQYDRLPAMAAELVQRHVDVILSNGVVTATLAAKKATPTIPIVFITGTDPVQAGLVASFNRPGGNLTGMTIIDTALLPKRLELLREVVPAATAIGLLLNPNSPNAESQVTELDRLVRANALRLKVATVRTEAELSPAFESLANDHADAVLAASDALLGGLGVQIVALAGRYKLPVIYPFPVPGGLMSYGITLEDVFRQIGNYTGKILKGEKPADLPVIQPTKVQLVVNLKTAKLLGLTLPLSVLARADEVIE